MRISSKSRYGLAAMIYIAQNAGLEEQITIISIAEKLGISKIYLEQVFAHLKRDGLVISVKGAQGGYRLSAPPSGITALQILRAIEVSLFEKTERSVSDEASSIDAAMDGLIWGPLDEGIIKTLEKVTLQDLAEDAGKRQHGDNYMFYI